MTSGKRNHDVVENPRACSGSIKQSRKAPDYGRDIEKDLPRPVPFTLPIPHMLILALMSAIRSYRSCVKIVANIVRAAILRTS